MKQALQENKSLHKRVRELLEVAMRAEASELLDAAVERNGFKIVQAIFEGRELEEARILASQIVRREPSVALLGTRNTDGARLVFARSTSLTQNMGQLLAEACAMLGGRGGGRPDSAQGGGPNADKLEDAIRVAFDKLTG